LCSLRNNLALTVRLKTSLTGKRGAGSRYSPSCREKLFGK
jgi:hypothetical protein